MVSAAIFFVTVGLALGNKGLDWIDIQDDGRQIRTLAEITLTLVLFADASRIDLRTAWREHAVPARLLGIGLPLTIFAGWLVGVVVFGDLGGAEVLILAVILAPTDAALGQAVVTDQRLPSQDPPGPERRERPERRALRPDPADRDRDRGHRRREDHRPSRGQARGRGRSAAAPSAASWRVALAALIVTVAVPRGLTSSSWLQIVPVAAAALGYGLASALDGSGFIAAFVGGIVYGALHPSTGGEASYLIEELGELTNAITFLVFGAVFVGPMLGESHVVGGALCAAQPDRGADDPGCDRARRRRVHGCRPRRTSAGSARGASPRSSSS